MIRIFKFGEVAPEEIFARFEPPVDVSGVVTEIIAAVREKGDAALREYARTFDKAELTALEVSPEEINDALKQVDPGLLEILRKAAANIRAYHSRQVRNSFIINDTPGIVIGQKVIPLDRVGLYVPGGTAVYPSTVLMDSIPATTPLTSTGGSNRAKISSGATSPYLKMRIMTVPPSGASGP